MTVVNWKGTPEDRFWSKVDKNGPNGCWNWIGFVAPDGYGQFSLTHDKTVLAHRYAYELIKGPIPEDTPELDHLCRNRACVNPEHLEPVTHKENQKRGIGFVAENMQKTHCKRGHPFVKTIEFVDEKGRFRTKRKCSECGAIDMQKFKDKEKLIIEQSRRTEPYIMPEDNIL